MKTLEEIRQERNLIVLTVGADGGAGEIRYGKLVGTVIWSFGGGWEHVSVCPYKHNYTPSWEEMCRLKDMFWHDDEVVVQYHPAKSQYVNNMPNCLHLWRPIDVTMPTPPSIMVGLRDGQSMASALEEMRGLKEVTVSDKWRYDFSCKDCLNTHLYGKDVYCVPMKDGRHPVHADDDYVVRCDEWKPAQMEMER